MQNLENDIHSNLTALLGKMGITINKLRLETTPEKGFKINMETSHPNLMIGHHGENIIALQHLLKLSVWKKYPEHPEISLDIDNYRKRQEENAIKIAERKVEMVRKLASPQSLPAMGAYLRRVVHLYLAQEKFNDIKTESQGEGEQRFIVIKPELVI